MIVGGDDHGGVARSERGESVGCPLARNLEPGAGALARLHAGRDVEHEQKRARVERCRFALDVWSDQPCDEHCGGREAQPEECGGSEAAAFGWSRRQSRPQEQRGDWNGTLRALPQMQRNQGDEQGKGHRTGRVQEAERTHRRRTKPSRASSPVTMSAMATSDVTRA